MKWNYLNSDKYQFKAPRIIDDQTIELKFRDFSAKHPEIIVEPKTTDINEYFGLIKCKILAPYGLYLS